VEAFLVKEAVLAGVVKEIKIKKARNPNKWEKKLAPWFSATCKEHKRLYR
jgi:hypothetical protein